MVSCCNWANHYPLIISHLISWWDSSPIVYDVTIKYPACIIAPTSQQTRKLMKETWIWIFFGYDAAPGNDSTSKVRRCAASTCNMRVNCMYMILQLQRRWFLWLVHVQLLGIWTWRLCFVFLFHKKHCIIWL